jgi:hypothetical protein
MDNSIELEPKVKLRLNGNPPAELTHEEAMIIWENIEKSEEIPKSFHLDLVDWMNWKERTSSANHITLN